MRSTLRWLIFGYWAIVGIGAPCMRAQGADVSATIVIQGKSKLADKRHRDKPSAANVVMWLSPLKTSEIKSPLPAHQTIYRLIQRDKMFVPHLLVVPTGSDVQFPNEDPFFHNVFSLFNGKRFDLGLYESGTSRSVRFDREGVSFIFCNIHPGMGAVVLALNTPYYGISKDDGTLSIHNVPPGGYQLNVWSENGQIGGPNVTQKIIQVPNSTLHLGAITLQTTVDPLIHHKNKFDEDYGPVRSPQY